MGFEPMIPFWGIHTFQACAIDQLGHLSVKFQIKNDPGSYIRNGRLNYKIISQTRTYCAFIMACAKLQWFFGFCPGKDILCKQFRHCSFMVRIPAS